LILYLHGFRSSPQSTKARQLREYMEAKGLGAKLICPDLPISPREAIAMTEKIVAAANEPLTLVGSSLGGFYATWLTEHYWQKIKCAVLINPAVGAHLLLTEHIGHHSNYHTGEDFEFTQAYVDELSALNVPLIEHPDRYWLLVETGDEVLDYTLAVSKYQDARQTVLTGGDHSFTRWTDYLEEIAAL
jgi:predicted esterase YcpF (UPF0227 family)